MSRWHLKHAVHGDKPWAVQAEAQRRSLDHPKFGYWLEMGLGKTALALNDYIDHEEVDLNIVVAPNSFKLDWALAPAEWGVGFLRTGMWPRDPLPYDWDNGVYAINYEAASRSKASEPLRKLMDERRVMLTIDESKALGNPRSGFTRAVIELAKRATIVRELNGTPMTQSVMDYYGQLRALGKLNGWNPVQFRNRYAVLGGFMGKQIMPEIRNGEELARLLDSCTFRALKEDWRKDLPAKTYTTVHLEMTAAQRSHYQTMMEDFYALIENDELSVDLVLTQMNKLRQISSGLLLDGDKVHYLVPPNENPKIKALPDLIGEYGKVIVSYFYKPSGRMIEDYLEKAGLKPAYIRGGMKPEEVIEQKRRFNEDSECRVIVGQQSATARGHTLIGQPGRDRCSRTVFFENDFSYYWRSQMEDRNHRGAQDEACSMIDLVTSPMDETLINILTSRRDLAASMDQLLDAVKQVRSR